MDNNYQCCYPQVWCGGVIMLEMQSVTRILRENGFKVTPQRLAVYEALSKAYNHPNAEMLYSMLQPDYPTMSLATVYKAMDIFSELGLVQVLNVGEDRYRYDAETVSHPHIRCVSCNRVDDVFDIGDEFLLDTVSAKSGYELTGRQLYFFGRCPECRKKLGRRDRH